MERNPIPRWQPPHWPGRGKKLMLYCLAAVLVFFLGMVLGDLLSQSSRAENPSLGLVENSPFIDVPYISQRERYPSGCESVSTVMALGHAGVSITVEEFIDSWLPQGSAPCDRDGTGRYVSSDPNVAFMGSPYSESGWGCYAPVIKAALDKLLAVKGSVLETVDLTGKGLDELCEEYIAKGTPVIVWATAFMEEPRYGQTLTGEETGRQFDWIAPEHCMLLVGEDEEHYYFNDPLAGKGVAYEKAATERAYEGLRQQALAIQ